jgi:hypothetical protein
MILHHAVLRADQSPMACVDPLGGTRHRPMGCRPSHPVRAITLLVLSRAE